MPTPRYLLQTSSLLPDSGPVSDSSDIPIRLAPPIETLDRKLDSTYRLYRPKSYAYGLSDVRLRPVINPALGV